MLRVHHERTLDLCLCFFRVSAFPVAAGEANAEAAATGQGTGVQLAVGGAHMLADAEEEQ
jgi:hypothetical protein